MKPICDICAEAVKIAEKFSNEQAKNQLLGEIVDVLVQAGQHTAALQTLPKITSMYERKRLLLGWSWKDITTEDIAKLAVMLESDDQTAMLAGRLATAMLDDGKTNEALLLIQSVKRPFETEKLRYSFIERYLQKTENVDAVVPLTDDFQDETYIAWSRLALLKKFADLQRWQEAETLVGRFENPQQQSWCFLELYTRNPQNKTYLERSAAILDDIGLPPDAESLAVQLRITGKRCYEASLRDTGAALLEKSEAAAKSVPLPLPRLRLQCFLAKVLRELKLIGSATSYIAVDAIEREPLSIIDKSRVQEWLNESFCRNVEDVHVLLEILNGKAADIDRAERIAEILKRAAVIAEHRKATGNPEEDAVNVSGEEYESYYFSPFAANDCGC